MRAFPILRSLPVLLLAACGSVRDRGDCAASPDCPTGQFCARTADGNVCWPDAVPPTVSGVTVSCASPCLRDGVLHVEASVADDREVLGAEVRLDVGGPAVPMARAGAVWAADVPLRQFPFDHFAHGVVATVTARDGARNQASLDAAAATTVTRLRFERSLDPGFIFSLGPPAVMQDGTVVTAGTNGKVYFVPWDGSGLSSLTVGAGQISAAPLVLGGSVWIGSEDNKVYELTPQAGTWTPAERADAVGAVRGSLASTSTGTVIATSDFGVVSAIPPLGAARNSGVGNPYSLGAVIDEADGVYSVAGGTVRKMTITLGIPGDVWLPAISLGSSVSSPLAWSNGLIALSNNGTDGFVNRIPSTGTEPEHLATTAISSGSPAIASDGSLLVPEVTKTLSRLTSTGAPAVGWQKSDLGGAVRTPLLLTSSGAPLVVSTSKGAVVALSSEGIPSWKGQVAGSNVALQPGNIFTPPTEPAGAELSTAYFAGSDGVLHAVIVDGKLDGSAPWPKAFHDPRNTNRAGPQP